MTKVSKDGINFHEIVEDFDPNTGIDKSLAAAQAKGYKPYVDVSKDGQKVYTIEGSADSLKAAQAKGYKLADSLKSAQAQYDKEKSAQLDSSEGRSETRLRGMAQGMTFGLADEAQAGVRSLLSDKSYKDLRDEYRHDDDLARKVNPGNMLGAEIVSNLPTIAATGGAGLAKTVAQNAGMGALNAFGGSESDNIKDLSLEALKGGAIGGAIPLAFKGAEKAYSGAKKLAGMAVRGVTDTSQEMIDRALNPRVINDVGEALTGSELLNTASNRGAVADKLETAAKVLKKKVSTGSSEARAILDNEGVDIHVGELVSSVNDEIFKLRAEGVFTDEAKKTLNRLQNLKNDIIREAGESQMLSGQHAKNLIQQVDEYAYKGSNPNIADFGKTDQNVFKSLRASFDDSLKSISPNYESKMASVAEDTGLLKDTKKIVSNPQATIKRQIGANSSDKNEEILNKLGLGNDIELLKLKKYFNSSTTNGSRKTMLGSAIGGAVGGVTGAFLGPLGAAVGGSVSGGVGAAVGATLDKHGRMMALKAFELAQKLEPRVAELGKYSKVLSEAAAKGPAAFLMTHELLLKNGKIDE